LTFLLLKRFHGARGHKSNRMTVTGFGLAQPAPTRAAMCDLPITLLIMGAATTVIARF
jgi:hypothetical protein